MISSSAEGRDTPKDIPAPVAEPDHVIKIIVFHRLTSTLGGLKNYSNTNPIYPIFLGARVVRA
jgi:hypothetical protein